MSVPPRPRLRFSNGFLILLVVAVGAVFFFMVRAFFVPVLLAAVFATLFFPLYEKLDRLLRGRSHVASFLTCLILLLGLLIPLYGIGELVVEEASEVLEDADQKVARLVEQGREWMDRLPDVPFVPTLDLSGVDWRGIVGDWAGGLGGFVAAVVNRTSRGTVQVVVTFFVTLFTMFYFFMDGRRLVDRLRYLVPLDESYEDAIVQKFVSVARGTVKGTLVIALIQGTMGALTLWAFGVTGAILWGVVMVVLSVIPVVGAWVVMYPAAIVELVQGRPWAALGIFLVTVVVILNVDNLLRPRLVGREAGMHDLLIFFSTLGGLLTFGAMGFIVGPVIAAFFISLLDIYAEEFSGTLDGRSAASLVVPQQREGPAGELVVEGDGPLPGGDEASRAGRKSEPTE